MSLIESIANKNSFPLFTSYLGAGAYQHHVPALVSAITSKSEFLTSYTPYQAEASQGMLQVIFEFQSAICGLSGLDVSNASLYDGATACAEAALMALRINKERTNIVVAQSLHPHYQRVIAQYLSTHAIEIRYIPTTSDWKIDVKAAHKLVDKNTTAVLLGYPNFFGIIDPVAEIAAHAKKLGALTVVSANPLVYGLYASAGELGADIAVGDAQPFGLSQSFGGPYLGYISCREEFLRQLPGTNRWRNKRHGRASRLCPDAPSARTTYPQRKSHIKYLHKPGPGCLGGFGGDPLVWQRRDQTTRPHKFPTMRILERRSLIYSWSLNRRGKRPLQRIPRFFWTSRQGSPGFLPKTLDRARDRPWNLSMKTTTTFCL